MSFVGAIVDPGRGRQYPTFDTIDDWDALVDRDRRRGGS
jgi:hypothetical protein